MTYAHDDRLFITSGTPTDVANAALFLGKAAIDPAQDMKRAKDQCGNQ